MTITTKAKSDIAPVPDDRLAQIKAMKDEDIDYSDISALDADFWNNAILRTPRDAKVPVALRLDPDVLAWFKAQGGGHTSRMAAILKHFYEHNRRTL
jgi:uncharacterized protein (DUF4415 family)